MDNLLTAINIVTAPDGYPVSRNEAKSHLRVINDDDDEYIVSLIGVATDWAENYTRRAFLTQTIEAFYKDFPCSNEVLELPKPRLKTLTHIKYYDTAGVEQDLSSSIYFLDTNTAPASLCLKSGQSFPDIETNHPSPIRIRYTCGYGAASDVPNAIKHGILLLVGHWYENRENVVVIHKALQVTKVPQAAESLLSQYRIYGVW